MSRKIAEIGLSAQSGATSQNGESGSALTVKIFSLHKLWGSYRRKRGAAAVEFAIVAPLFFMLLFGMIEYGRCVLVQQMLTNASREGARRGVLDGTTTQDVVDVVQSYLASSFGLGSFGHGESEPPEQRSRRRSGDGYRAGCLSGRELVAHTDVFGQRDAFGHIGDAPRECAVSESTKRAEGARRDSVTLAAVQRGEREGERDASQDTHLVLNRHRLRIGRLHGGQPVSGARIG